MKIADENRDAIEIIKDLKKEMEEVRQLLAALEYVVYECDDRCVIRFIGRGEDDEKGSQE